MKTTITLLIVILLTGIFSGGCVEKKTGGELETLKVGYLPLISFGPLFIANDEGYFAEQGIKIELIKFQSGPQGIPPLVQGEIDVVGGTLSPGLFNANKRGMEIKIVADKGYTDSQCDNYALAVRKDLYDNGSLNKIEQMKGKKIASPATGGLADYFLMKTLSRANLTFKDIEVIDMSFPSMVAAFENNAIDASVIAEPHLSQVMEMERAEILAKPWDVIPNSAGTPLLFGPNLLEKKPELGKKFMVAYLKGVRKYSEGKTQRNLEILKNYTQLDGDLLEKSCWAAVKQDGYIEKKPLMEYQDWLYENKYINAKIPEEQFIDMSYVDYANKALEKSSK